MSDIKTNKNILTSVAFYEVTVRNTHYSIKVSHRLVQKQKDNNNNRLRGLQMCFSNKTRTDEPIGGTFSAVFMANTRCHAKIILFSPLLKLISQVDTLNTHTLQMITHTRDFRKDGSNRKYGVSVSRCFFSCCPLVTGADTWREIFLTYCSLYTVRAQ